MKAKRQKLTPAERARHEKVKRHLKGIIRALALPMPRIGVAYESDPCDVTAIYEIRLNVRKADLSPKEHALHVAGHHVCNLEATRLSDRIADMVGGWIYVAVYGAMG